MKKLFHSWLLVLFLLPFVGQAGFSPDPGGITSDDYPNGLSWNEFNRFTDDGELANRRRGLQGFPTATNWSAYKDEREFMAIAKGTCYNTVQHCAMGGGNPDLAQPYSFSLSNLQEGDTFNLHIYLHNNAQQDAGYTATGTQVVLDWSSLGSSGGQINASLSASNIPNNRPNPRYAWVNISFSDPNLTIQKIGGGSATNATMNIGGVAGSYAYVQDHIVNFEVVSIPTFCGDGTIQVPNDNGINEECDDGAANSDTTPNVCRTDCTLPICGDNVTDTDYNETCDDGNNLNTDGCLNSCTVASCGDGFVWSGQEACDDGNTSLTDQCNNSC
ncbi:DUF4215 domain-containing protein [Candidatus Gracilibacteria bacterium]|nr:DUF4215 domain-containing protein [Candidatus Gracilibacteria bacterium]MCF7819824.1 DUF4215 domain-containing protein [Candidatus Gracilibacteria bacterium]